MDKRKIGISIHIPIELKKALDKIREEKGITLTFLIVKAVESFIESQSKKES